jgi:hypothetical protein
MQATLHSVYRNDLTQECFFQKRKVLPDIVLSARGLVLRTGNWMPLITEHKDRTLLLTLTF